MDGYFPNTVIGKSPKEHNMFEGTLDFSGAVNLVQVLLKTYFYQNPYNLVSRGHSMQLASSFMWRRRLLADLKDS